MRNNSLLFVLLLFFQFVSSQSVDEKQLFFKVLTDSTAIENVNIVNIRNEKATVSDKNGTFTIIVAVGDVLVLSAVNLETKRKTISEEDLKSEMIIIKMDVKTNRLKEVTVNENSTINAVSLGILQKEAKKYTPAERKLYTANSGILSSLLNKISGRTAMLKKEIVVEKKERLLIRLDGYYEKKHYAEVLKIPEEYIKGFQYYILENADFVRALNAKNKSMTSFLMGELAVKYIEIITSEKSNSK